MTEDLSLKISAGFNTKNHCCSILCRFKSRNMFFNLWNADSWKHTFDLQTCFIKISSVWSKVWPPFSVIFLWLKNILLQLVLLLSQHLPSDECYRNCSRFLNLLKQPPLAVRGTNSGRIYGLKKSLYNIADAFCMIVRRVVCSWFCIWSAVHSLSNFYILQCLWLLFLLT